MLGHSTYRFGAFEVRLRTRELYKYGTRLKLRPQPFRILQILLERDGEVVTREELHEALWPGRAFVDFEHGINNAIKELRGILSDSASKPQLIETLPRLGYRMLVPVECGDSPPLHGSVTRQEAHKERFATGQNSEIGVSPRLPSSPRSALLPRGPVPRWPLIVTLGVLSSMAIIAYFAWWHPTKLSQASGRVMLAVLPFENFTGDAGQDYLGDGLTEELISQLGQVDTRRLGVIAHTSVMHYKNSSEPLEKIGRTLQVQYALEGSVRRASGRLRVSAQLVDMKGHTVWSRAYDRETADLLAIQDEIAREISDEIALKLGGSESTAPRKVAPTNANVSEAHDLYLRGIYFLNKRNQPGLYQAVLYFQQATAKDPGYAPAYAALANSYVLFSGYSGGLGTQYMPKARDAALRSLELDGNLPEAHAALALIAQIYDWDWQTAENEYLQAIRLNPNYATAHHWYAEHLAFRGRFEEALAESERAKQIDPLSMIILADRGMMLYYARRYDDSIKQFGAVREMEPAFARAGMILYPQVEKQLYPEAFKLLEQERQNGENAWYWATLAYVYGRSGREKEARHALEKVKELNQREPSDPGIVLWATLGMSDRDQTFFWMEKAYSQHSNVLAALKVDPAFDPLRSDPRFQEMVRRVRLD